ncbi:MAG: hypothetical protein JWL73_271 [Actinomycetia bacterium]|nr:hypothetical protein [Actinomycetes bacterium]
MTTLDFWFDPGCPFTWNTSRWAIEAAPQRGVEIRWQPFSLKVKNGDGVPAQFVERLNVGHSALRIVVAIDELDGNAAVGRFYTAYGRRLFHDEQDPTRDMVVSALADAGLNPSYIDAFDDEDRDAAIKQSMKVALDMVGEDVGVPILSFDREPRLGFFGPVVSPPPTGEDAVKLWDAYEVLVTMPEVFEIKRARNGPVLLGARP